METSPKVINQAEPEVLAKVNNGRSPYSELNGAIGEARGWSQAIESGQTPISGIYHTNSPELASYYSKVFTDAGVTNFKFVITPATK